MKNTYWANTSAYQLFVTTFKRTPLLKTRLEKNDCFSLQQKKLLKE